MTSLVELMFRDFMICYYVTNYLGQPENPTGAYPSAFVLEINLANRSPDDYKYSLRAIFGIVGKRTKYLSKCMRVFQITRYEQGAAGIYFAGRYGQAHVMNRL